MFRVTNRALLRRLGMMGVGMFNLFHMLVMLESAVYAIKMIVTEIMLLKCIVDTATWRLLNVVEM